MITELQIENLGVIERLELVLGPGLTALTGETGAGKTMLVDAIELLVGGRADATMVRHGAAEARIAGRFVDAGGAETVLTRVIPSTGRSRAYVNGRLATVASLADATAEAIDLHGQHAHQSLLSTATQRAALDEYGDVDLEPLRAARARLTELDAELATLGGDERSRAREIDLLRYQIADVEAIHIESPDEDLRLDEEETVLADATAHRDAGEATIALLSADRGARDEIAAALGALADRIPFGPPTERLRDVLAELDDIVAEVRSRTEQIDESPQRLSEVRERRQLLKDLRRKYGDDLTAVMGFLADARARLRELEGFEERAARLDDEREEAQVVERRAASVVGSQRRHAAPLLGSEVEEQLRELAMPHVDVAVQVGDGPDDDPGDRVSFLLAVNPGSPLLPLTRVASGGELARAMLALRLVLAGGRNPSAHSGTLVFDEVDAGIGGAAAQSIGNALAALGRRQQVLVVTHLAQVAAAADAQIAVSKVVRRGSTFATARPVDAEVRVGEIARMLAGSDSESAREHARDLLR